jgi:hypothetical protein
VPVLDLLGGVPEPEGSGVGVHVVLGPGVAFEDISGQRRCEVLRGGGDGEHLEHGLAAEGLGKRSHPRVERPAEGLEPAQLPREVDAELEESVDAPLVLACVGDLLPEEPADLPSCVVVVHVGQGVAQRVVEEPLAGGEQQVADVHRVGGLRIPVEPGDGEQREVEGGAAWCHRWPLDRGGSVEHSETLPHSR